MVSIMGSTITKQAESKTAEPEKDSLAGTWLFTLQHKNDRESYGTIIFNEDGTAIAYDTTVSHGLWEEVEPGHIKVVLINVLQGTPALRSKCEIDVEITDNSASGSLVQTFYPPYDLRLSQAFPNKADANITATRFKTN